MVGGFIKRCVLAHDAGQETAGVGAIPGGHLVQHGEAVVYVAGQGQMPQDDAFLQDAVRIEDRVPGLRHHGFDAGSGHRKVIRRGRKLGGQGRGDVLQVGQPDVDIPPPALDALQRLIAAGVADNGEVQPLRPRQVERSDDPRLPLAGRDQIDVVRALRLQVQKDLGQMPDGDLLAEPLGADGVVLAEAALEGAAGKEHRAAAPCAADAGLFPEMEGGAGGFQRTACPAEADPPGGAVRAALPGAKRAGFGCEVGGFGHTI